jgi:nitrite reductase/ring-hydroxylating ferredoxin subunit
MICKLAEIEDVKEDIWHEFSLQVDQNLYSIMLIKKQDQYLGFKNSCPHQGRRMDYASGKFLISESGNIICPAHGAEFQADDGLCIGGPCLGQALESIKIKTNDDSIFAII